MASRDHLLWIDLETTGTDAIRDEIVEVGAILTDLDLTVVDDFHTVVSPTEAAYNRMLDNSTVYAMHENSELLAELAANDVPIVGKVDAELIRWLKGHDVRRGRAVLAGSGVARFDQWFIVAQMPRLHAYLDGRLFDIAILRQAYRMWTDTDLPAVSSSHKTHRALDDIRYHLDEARGLRDLLATSTK